MDIGESRISKFLVASSELKPIIDEKKRGCKGKIILPL